MREALSWCPECIWFSVNSSDFICFGEICFRCLVSFLITPVILLQEHFYTWLFCISFQIKVLFPPVHPGLGLGSSFSTQVHVSVLDRGWELRLWHWFCILIPAVWPWASHFISLSLKMVPLSLLFSRQPCPTLMSHPMDCGSPGFPVHHCKTVSTSWYWDVK